MRLCLPRLAGIIVQIDHVMHRLVAMRILPHVGGHHLDHLMDHAAVGSGAHRRWRGKHGVQFGGVILVATHQPHQAGFILHHAPGPLPRIAFGERTAPFFGIKRFVPRTVRLASAHEPGLPVEQVGVIHRPLRKDRRLGIFANGVRQLRGAKIVISEFQSFRPGLTVGLLVARHIGIRHIAQRVVRFRPVAANRPAAGGRLRIRIVNHRRHCPVGVKGADALHPAIRQQ